MNVKDLVRKVEWVGLGSVLLLVTPGSLAASESHAPTRQPEWTNSLGMRFVSFGPTNVMMSIWETRNCDYQAFVDEAGVPWRDKDNAAENPLHPAVGMSWMSATGFCAWLTAKELREGLIQQDWEYRLPKDLEWGKALGLKKEPGDSPLERFFYGGPKLPWGEHWPPPVGFANLGRSLGIDDWPDTSPVGSFPPNAFGIYDMVGNVYEWCWDLYFPRQDQTNRTVRGTCYASRSRNECAAATRVGRAQDKELNAVGFRCVFARKESAEEKKYE